MSEIRCRWCAAEIEKMPQGGRWRHVRTQMMGCRDFFDEPQTATPTRSAVES